MDKKLVLVGGGGHCKSVIDSLSEKNEYSEIVITDYSLPEGTIVNGCKVVGNDDCLPDLKNNGFDYAFITMGSVGKPNVRASLVEEIEKLGFLSPIIIDSTAVIADDVHIGHGTFIGKNATINTGVSIGSHCIINTGCIIEHESVIGDKCHIATGAILCGGVHVGNDSFVGAGSTVIQGHMIGENATIGAETVVTKDIPAWTTAVGIPAKVIKNNREQ